MEIAVIGGDVLAQHGALAIIGVHQGDPLPEPLAGLIEPADFIAKANQIRVVYSHGAVSPTRVLLVGLGERTSVTAERLRQGAATAIRAAREYQVGEVTLGVLGELVIDPFAAGQALAEGLELGAYRYLNHKTGLPPEELFEIGQVTVVVAADTDTANADTAGSVDAVREGMAVGHKVARATILARDLVNRPPEFKTPPLLAQEAVTLGDRVPGVTVTVFDEHRLADEGFGGILAVGKGSDAKPRFIIMEYGGDLEGVPTICVVGKGLTFDSGGYNIKPEEGMLQMKNDMGGSAAVFGIVQAVAELELPVHLVALIPSAENMISGGAYRPGDIITSLSGKTMEILNTDAEGRVILSDALHYAQRYQPDAIISLATLTGAVIVALGHTASGVMATDQPLADGLLAAGETSGDRAWQLPLWEDYIELIKGEVGDIKNLAGRAAGSITAAAFLAEFVGDYPYAHLDIAGTAWLDAPKKPYHFRGGTGSGVRLVVEFLRNSGG